MVSKSFVVFPEAPDLPSGAVVGLVSNHRQNKNATSKRGATIQRKDFEMQNNFSRNQNPESTINKPNPKYSHLSEDAQKFLEHCDKHDVPSIQKHTGRDAEFKTRPFQSNGNGDMPDYLCVRFLASVSYRENLTAWHIFQIKSSGFLLVNYSWQKPCFSQFHLTFDTLEEIRQHSMAPVEVVLDAKKALRKFREIDTESELKDEPERQPMIGIPTQKSNFRKFRSKDSSSDGVGWERRGSRSEGRQKDEPTVAIKPKGKKGKLKTEAELKKLSDALLNVDIHVPTTPDNYWLMGRGEF